MLLNQGQIYSHILGPLLSPLFARPQGHLHECFALRSMLLQGIVGVLQH